MKHQATRQLFAYWNDIRGERTAPERSDIDPSAIREVLADTFMLDVDLEKRFPFRLAGTRVNGLFDADQKGLSILDRWRPEERRNIAAILLTVVDGACPVVAGAVAATETGDECAIEVLFLPLRHHSRTHDRILGLMKPIKTTAWLGLMPLGPLTLRSLRIIDPLECEIEKPAEKIAVGQSAPFVTTDDFGTRSPARPHLRLIQGGRAS